MRRFAALLLASCSSAPITVSDGSVHQVSWDMRYETHVPAVVVVSVDDVNDAAGAAMREAFTPATVAPSLDALLRLYSGDPNPTDPASGVVQDLRVVVVHPSTGTFVSPLDDPTLAISALSVSSIDVSALAGAVASHAQEEVALGGAPYPLLGTTRDVVALIARERAPRDDREAAFVASFPAAWAAIDVALVTAHDDASAADPSTFAPPASEAGGNVFYLVDEPCVATFPRIDAWHDALARESVLLESTASCDPNAQPLALAVADTADGACTDPLADGLARDDSGAEWVVTFDSPTATSCDPARGWADTIGDDGTRKPYLVDDDGTPARRCEILQLEGDARTSCETTLACSGCAPGVCYPRSISASSPGCAPFVRFVDGAGPSNASLHFTCNLSR